MAGLTEPFHFLRTALGNYRATGAVLPSSRALARSITSAIRPGPPPRRILEAGPGTGAFTREIARRMGPEDRLDLFEVVEGFVRFLEAARDRDPALGPARDRIRIFHAPVERADGVRREYDHVVCGIPFNNLHPREVRAIFRAFRRLLRPGGTVSYFEYIGMRPIRMSVSGAAGRERSRRIGAYLEILGRAHGLATSRVLGNVPPARVHHLKF